MAIKNTNVQLALIYLAIICGGAAAQSGCTNVLISLSPCLNYITGNSSTPSSGCCNQLASVVSSQPECLCQVLNGGASSLGLNINQTQALALPRVCNIQTPPISQCNGNSAPRAESPAKAPGSPTTIPSGRGSNTVPSTEEDGTSSDASSCKLSISLLFFVFASYASSLIMH